LHARVDGVVSDSWAHEQLVQIWFRWADYVVPRVDVGVFTLGTLPRHPEQHAALDQLADRVLSILSGSERPAREVGAELGHPALLRCSAGTGKVHIRWDARTITVRPAQPADIDEERARVELARRFLRWFGPGTLCAFAKWAGVTMADAQSTWAALRSELVPVAVGVEGGWILAEDEPELRATGLDVSGVRLLPLGDPYLWPLGGMGAKLPTDFAHRLLADNVPTRVVNGLAGRILVDGEITGAWGRDGTNFTLLAFTDWSEARRESLSAEATRIAALIGRPVKVAWLGPVRADSSCE
jgi:hypothetical protein